MGVSGRRRHWNYCWLLVSCIPDVLFSNLFTVGEQGSFTSSFSRQWLFLSKFFSVWKRLQRFLLWDWMIIIIIIIIMWIIWVNWTTMKLIAVRSQYIWNMHSSLLNVCNCMQIDSSDRKGELKSFERGLEVYNFYLTPESKIYLFFLPLDLDEMYFKKKKKLLWDPWRFKWGIFQMASWWSILVRILAG